MTPLAQDFASSPAGYVTTLLGSAMLLAIGWLFRTQFTANNEFRLALAQNAQALAVLVVQATDDRADAATQSSDVRILNGRHNELDRAVAVLADRLNRYEAERLRARGAA